MIRSCYPISEELTFRGWGVQWRAILVGDKRTLSSNSRVPACGRWRAGDKNMGYTLGFAPDRDNH